MKFSLASGLALFAGLLLSGCAHSSNQVSVGGNPGWFADAARREFEPIHFRPEPDRTAHEGGAGPARVQIVTDRRSYPEPPARKRERLKSTGSLGNKSRDSSIPKIIR